MPLPPRLAWLLLAPAALLLLLVFLLPLAWFLTGSLGEIGSWSDIVEQTGAVLTSRAMRQSMWVTAQIGLATTVVVLLIGYPLAYALVRSDRVAFRIIIACVLLPYFT